MLDDAKSGTSLISHLATAYVAAITPQRDCPLTNPPATTHAPSCTSSPPQRAWTLKARCRAPQPNLNLGHAFLWGAGVSLSTTLASVLPATHQHCCRAAKDMHDPHGRNTAATAPEAVWKVPCCDSPTSAPSVGSNFPARLSHGRYRPLLHLAAAVCSPLTVRAHAHAHMHTRLLLSLSGRRYTSVSAVPPQNRSGSTP